MNTDYKFGEYIKDREQRFTGKRPNGTDLVRISDCVQYYTGYKQKLSERAETKPTSGRNDKKALPIQNVSFELPDRFWFSDEKGTEVTVIGIVDKWCIVTDIHNEVPYALPFEFIHSIYKDSISKGN